MSGFVPRRVAMTRTASATTDMKAATFNNQLISTIGRRKTLRNQIQKRSFGSFLQIDYTNAVGNKCEREYLAPVRNKGTLQLVKDVPLNVELFKDVNTMGFVMKSLQADIVKLGGGSTTDNLCGFGAINNYAEDIIMPIFNPSKNAHAASGARILAFERWYNTSGGGWDAIASSANSTSADRYSLVLALEGDLNTSGLEVPLYLNGVLYKVEDIVKPAQFGNSPNGVARYGTGTGATPFTLIRYGGSGSNSASDPDTDFSTGFNSDNKKNVTVRFTDPP